MAGVSKSTADLITEIGNTIYPNAANEINASNHQQLLLDMLASVYTKITDGSLVETQPNKRETLAAGVNTITFSSAMSSTDYTVSITEVGRAGAGIGRPYDFTVNGFKIDAVKAGDIMYQTQYEV